MLLKQDGQYTPGRESRWFEGNRLILDLLETGKKVRVLDIGCGEASGFNFLKQDAVTRNVSLENLEYHAIDNNPDIVNILKNSGIEFHLGDIQDLEKIYKPNFFDVIVASEIIEHMVDTDRFILSLKNLLKDNGYIYLTTPNMASWHGRLMLLFGYQPLCTEVSSVRAEFGKGNILKKYYHGNAIMHVRVFTLRALLDFLKFHGFVIEHIWGGGYRKLDNLIFNKYFLGLTTIIKVIMKKDLNAKSS